MASGLRLRRCPSLYASLPAGSDEVGFLVDIVANARYDSSRYPAHVAQVTDRRPAVLKDLINVTSYSIWGWMWRIAIAALVTFAVPFSALHFKSPQQCQILDVMRHAISEETEIETDDYDHDMCVKHLRHDTFAAVCAVFIGPVYNLVVSVLCWLSLRFTTRLYSRYVKFICRLFEVLQPYCGPLLVGRTKDQSCELGSVYKVWRRLAIFPYTILYWLGGIVVVVGLWNWRNVAFSGVLLVFVWQVYLPLVVQLFSVNPALQDVVFSELGKRTMPKKGQRNSVLEMDRLDKLADTDLWLRLFHHTGAVISISSAELELIMRYFEHSHRGVDGDRWPIWWHDDLCVTGNQTLTKVYIYDLNILVCGVLGTSVTDPEKNDQRKDFHEYVDKCAQRLDTLYRERCPDADSTKLLAGGQ